MNILIISQFFYPDTFRINEIVAALVQDGHKVTVLTGLPDYAMGKVPKEYYGLRHFKDNYCGASIIRIPTISRGNGALRRFANYASFALNASLYSLVAKLVTFDVIYIYAMSPITMAIPALILKKKYKKEVLLYCLDLWPESVKAFGIKENSLIFKAISLMTNYLYGKCDMVTVTSTTFISYLRNTNHYVGPIEYRPQHGEDKYLGLSSLAQKNECINFLFAGNIGTFQDIDKIIEAIHILHDSCSVKLHIVGDGSNLSNIRDMVATLNLEKYVTFYGRKAPDDMPEYYQLADACILTLQGSSLIGLSIPGKLQTYMAAGKPVIAAIDGAAKEIIELAECGQCVPAGDSLALAAAMRDFVLHREKYDKYGDNGREYYCKNFTKDVFMKQLEQDLFSLVERSKCDV